MDGAVDFEGTTATTDGILAAVSALGILFLRRATPPGPLRTLWLMALAGWGVSALLGAVTHGLVLDPRIES
ncbi:MAG: DUF6962 family protein, partial [Gemmatimonadales bacterium]